MRISPMDNASEVNERDGRLRIAGMPIPAIAFLALSGAIEFLVSHYQLLSGDEFGFGLLYIDRISTLSQLIHLQLTIPISFDPMGYNALIQAIIHIFGPTAFAMRLPSMCGYLLMQASLFYFVRRIANEQSATFALAIPALLGVVSYSVDARPYGLLLGLSALAVLSWQTATRYSPKRPLALVVLSLSLFVVINLQYYGVLLIVPLFAAEIMRSLHRRGIDIQLLVSITAGMAGVVVAAPFAKVLSQFRVNHSATGVSYHFIEHSYLWLLIGYESFTVHVQHIIGLGTILAFLALLIVFIWLRERIILRLPPAEIILILMIAMFPVLAYLLAKLVTHFVEARYIQPAIIGIIAIVAVMLAPLLQSKPVGHTILVILFVMTVGYGVVRIYSSRKHTAEMVTSLRLSNETEHNLEKYPTQPIYVVNHSIYEFVHYYAPSSEIRSRIALVFPKDSASQSDVGADTSRQVINMWADGVPNVAPFESLRTPRAGHLFVLNHYPWEWIDQQIAAAHGEVTYLGPAYGGDLVSVRFP